MIRGFSWVEARIGGTPSLGREQFHRNDYGGQKVDKGSEDPHQRGSEHLIVQRSLAENVRRSAVSGIHGVVTEAEEGSQDTARLPKWPNSGLRMEFRG